MIDVEPGDTTGARHALAFDLGTTTVVATLLDLESGQPLAVQSLLNAQQPFGGDVISRISATMMDPDALDTLRSRAHETMAALATEVCEEAGIAPEQVYEITVCGNATMMHLALGIDPEPLSMAPFTVTTHELPETLASDFGVGVHPRAPAFVFPSLGAYVGGDIVAGMLATGLTRDRRIRLFIDVGTNSEIALGCEERVLATAAPAGPAFEAAQIRCGMRAAEGAIEGIRIADDDVELQVIGDAEPVGLCGSGLVDCVAELVRSGLLDHSGRFIPDEEAAERLPALAPRLTKIGEERVFVMHWRGEDPAESIFLSQRDVRELQFAKASIATGWKILLREYGIEPGDIQQVLLAGQLRRLPVPRQRRAHRARAAPGAAAHRLGRQRGRRGGEDRRPQPPRARRGALDRARGGVRRAVGPRRLQRPLRRRAGAAGMSMAVVACGALAMHVRQIARRRGWDVDVVPVPALLHNRPEQIPGAVAELADELGERYDRVVLGYGDCGTYGALDELGLERLRGEHCYDVFAREEVAAAMAAEPGTYFLTDFLARTFEHTVVRELGLDRHPELRDVYFGAYRRVVWLAQRRTPAAERAAQRRPRASGCRSRCARWATRGSRPSSSGSWRNRHGKIRPGVAAETENMERSGRAGRCAAHCVPGRAARRRRRLSAGQSVLES